ncbi:unnamed protein product [Lepeophtheirus salmonis]|uniref:(salmon louse) hypothetical protein n=1 Tax=Lepeophtheirus salmonis TaxID=72036 RepID=A0A7R8CN42_LEPSM|nr:unnamed protein product [Lepeophtheirus salmonis]CAF2869547.1 unnamed protein product [Lepeophtheirus salmonis]
MIEPKCASGEIWCSLKNSCVATCCSEKYIQKQWNKCSIFLLNSGYCEKLEPCLQGTDTSKPLSFEVISTFTISNNMETNNYEFIIKSEIEITAIHHFGLRCPITGTCANLEMILQKHIEMNIIGIELDELQFEQQFFCDKPSLKNIELSISDGSAAPSIKTSSDLHCYDKVETLSQIVTDHIKYMNVTHSNSSIDLVLEYGDVQEFIVEFHTNGSLTEINWGVNSIDECKPIETDEGKASVLLKNNIPYLLKSSSPQNNCEFPFLYDGEIYYGCMTLEDSFGSPAYLCPEAVNEYYRALNLIRCNDYCHIQNSDRDLPFCENNKCVESFKFSKMGITSGVHKTASDGSMGLYGPNLEIIIPSFSYTSGVFWI